MAQAQTPQQVRARMLAAIQGGGTTYFKGKRISRVEDVPEEDGIAETLGGQQSASPEPQQATAFDLLARLQALEGRVDELEARTDEFEVALDGDEDEGGSEDGGEPVDPDGGATTDAPETQSKKRSKRRARGK